jgi:uncharacterized damage-inducible protein DinB
MNGSLLRDAFEHHAWANGRVLDACAALAPDQLGQSVPGTFGPIIETLRHLIGADAGYLHVIGGGEVEELDEERPTTLQELRAANERHAAAWVAFLERDLDPTTIVVRHRDDGTDSAAPLGVRLAQAVHHGTDHRSQVCTALTSLGLEPPAIDVWDWAETRGLISVTPTAG